MTLVRNSEELLRDKNILTRKWITLGYSYPGTFFFFSFPFLLFPFPFFLGIANKINFRHSWLPSTHNFPSLLLCLFFLNAYWLLLLTLFQLIKLYFPSFKIYFKSQSSLGCTSSKLKIETSARKWNSKISKKVLGNSKETEGLHEKNVWTDFCNVVEEREIFDLLISTRM